MPNPGQELSSIDFAAMLGGPLIAVVNAQAQAAMSTVNFIKEVGFKKTAALGGPEEQATEEPIYVKFKYPKEITPYSPAVVAGPNNDPPASPAVPAKYETHELEVPILTMLPIPYLRIDLTTIDFNAKINSVEYAKSDTSVKVNAELEAKAGWLWGSARLKVSASYQRNTQQGTSVDRTYSLAIHIKAVQDEMPAGMEKVLSILENAIASHPAGLNPVQ
jgi:uncharacterized protein DUF2589